MSEIIFKRKIYSEILKWKNEKKGSTALLVQGARRVGKSTIVREFARNEYKSYIAIDFAKASNAVKSLFDDLDDVDFIFLQLQAMYNVNLHRRESVIIFDEVQLCPKARQAIKYLVEDGRYDYIETGSLISIRKNTAGILIPSEETRISMFPMDYEEFLWAIGDINTYPLIEHCFEHSKPLADDMHRQMMRKFRLYMLVGGMPQSVKTYIDSNNLAAVDSVKREIIQLYLEDLRKIDTTGKAARMFESIPGQLAMNKLRFEPWGVDANLSADKLADVWQDLEESLTVNFSYRTADPNIGWGLHKDLVSFKIFLGDTGLFITLAFWDNANSENTLYQKLLSDKLSANLGYVFENAVAQILRANRHSLYYYTFPTDETKKKYYEIDFLTVTNNKINPIEVKSSGYKAHTSLDKFRDKYSSRIRQSYVIYGKNLQQEEGIIYLPFYMTPFL